VQKSCKPRWHASGKPLPNSAFAQLAKANAALRGCSMSSLRFRSSMRFIGQVMCSHYWTVWRGFFAAGASEADDQTMVPELILPRRKGQAAR